MSEENKDDRLSPLAALSVRLLNIAPTDKRGEETYKQDCADLVTASRILAELDRVPFGPMGIQVKGKWVAATEPALWDCARKVGNCLRIAWEMRLSVSDERTADSGRLDEDDPAAITSQMSDEDVLKLAELHDELMNSSAAAVIRHFVTLRKAVREAKDCLKECDSCYKVRKLVAVLENAKVER